MPRPVKDFPLSFRREIKKQLKSRDRDQRNLLKLIRAYTYLSDDYATFGQELHELELRFPDMGKTDKGNRSHFRAPFTDKKATGRRARPAPR